VPREKILWIEAIPKNVEHCRQTYPGIRIEQAVVSDTKETVQFNISSNNGESSSFLELEKHKEYYPWIHYTHYFITETQRLENILDRYTDTVFNLLSLDIQGTELRALRGMENYLKNVDAIYSEVNKTYLYKDCALIE
jgi:FkbM family methyltransferase